MALVDAEVVETMPALPAKAGEIERQGVTLLAEVEALVVDSDSGYGVAVDYAKLGRRIVKAAKELMDPIVEAAHQAHKTAVDQRRKLVEPGERIAKLADQKALGWHEAQEAARKAAEEALRKEQERREAEARAEAERESARLRKVAEDEALAAAAEAEARGDTETAERLLAEPVVVVPVVPTPVVTFTPPVPLTSAPKVEGYGFRTTYKAEMASLDALIRAAADGNTTARACLAFNQPVADGLARSTRGSVQIPGVRFLEVKTAQGRA